MNITPPNELVRIRRTEGLDELVCHPVLSTADCVVASELSESLDLDGLCLIPMRTILYFDRDFDRAEFYRAAISAWPSNPFNEWLSSQLSCNLLEDLKLLERLGEFVALHLEIEDPDVAYVGTLGNVSATELSVTRVSSRGSRITEPLTIDLKALTKVEVGTRYLRAVRHAHTVLAARSEPR